MSSSVHNPVEMIFYRGIVALGLLVPYMLARHPLSVFKTRRIGAHLYRSGGGQYRRGTGFLGLFPDAPWPTPRRCCLLPRFSSPSCHRCFSGKRVDTGRWIAVMAGFGGILLIARPSVGLLGDPASVVAIGAAFVYGPGGHGAAQSGTFRESPDDGILFHSWAGVILSAPYTLMVGHLPDGRMLPWILGIGVFTAIQQLAKTAAFRHCEASFLAPYTYTSMVWATLVGWLLWREILTMPVLLGTGVVIASNLFILQRSRGDNVLLIYMRLPCRPYKLVLTRERHFHYSAFCC